jgi:hypothetical protein
MIQYVKDNYNHIIDDSGYTVTYAICQLTTFVLQVFNFH